MIGAFKSIGIAADRYDKSRYDQYFDRVGLLLHCNGTNGGTVFTDSSSRSTSCTVTGGVTTSTTNPKFGSACLLGVGASGYVTASYNASVVLGANDFCVEFWVNPTSFLAGSSILFSNYNSTSSVGFAIVLNNVGEIRVYASTGGATWTIFSNALVGSVSLSTYSHVSVSRSGNNYYGSINGTVVSLGSFAGTINNPAVGYFVGGSPTGAFEINGRMDDVRLTIGTAAARYTSNFTPPIYPFADLWNDSTFSNVGLLLHCDGVNGSTSFPDSGPSSRSFTANGSAQVSTTQSKFGGASCRVTSAGSSFLSTPWNSSFGQLNATAWTAECWARADGTASNGSVLACTQGGNSGFSIFQLGTNWWTYINGYTSGTTIQGAAITANQWVHLAASHDGTVCRFFCDGVLINSATVAVGNTTTAPFLVGGMNATNGWNSSIYFDGYVDDVRFTKGVARYTSNFTPPALPFPNF